VNDTVSAKDIQQYWIKEDFFFDMNRSVLDVRIVGISPVKYDADKGCYIPLFWLYFNECRPLLCNNLAYNPFNDNDRRSFDDLFLKRKFHSFIYKESNVFDRSINDYAHGLDALLEAEKIKESLRNFECDLWEN
jgi:gliding motility associated protien GldN